MKPDEEFLGRKLFNPKRCIEVSSQIARIAANIRKEQREKGSRLKTADALIIATAKEQKLTLVSRDKDMNFIGDYGMELIKP